MNPLGAALHHYQAELLSVLEASDRRIEALETLEPRAAECSRVVWLLRYLALLASAGRRARREPRARLIVVWPVLGYLDLVLLRAAAGTHGSLVMHDPVPLVRGIGYGRAARWLGRTFGRGVTVIVHSRAAREALDAGIADDRVSLLPHPMLPPRSEISRSSRTSGSPVVRVLGQYKAERDVDMLCRLSSSFQGTADLQVHGRGWPDVPGWSVHCAFVTEEEMEELISSSDVVLVPYKRFFQSGIAIRCLENRTPFVGPAGSSLDELYGGASSMLAREPGEWLAAIRYAIDQGREETTRAGWSWRSRCEKAWSRWPNR